MLTFRRSAPKTGNFIHVFQSEEYIGAFNRDGTFILSSEINFPFQLSPNDIGRLWSKMCDIKDLEKKELEILGV